MNEAISDDVAAVKPKPQTIHSRVSADEYDAIDAAAKAADMTMSAFFKVVLLQGSGVKPVFNAEDRALLSLLLEDMRMIGVNLNQVARALNSGKSVSDSEIRIVVGDVQKMQVAVLSELRRVTKRSGYRHRSKD
ncbi:plasmid mobilization relaxosome protein MobC [Brucella pseudogrignonensis]|uniref:plasmid mobilization protein n=1 Tax=Brucella pseudogrignonensis TaxID=419475 RepID=UPI0028BCDA0E|nr:plasmid mobilization relaxosome protein MobC [Brucella pseudogrignonensis]MDT6942462.1 plasmid mobilization relaxosome protein MobC [Brucella pseudogrignonensis]